MMAMAATAALAASLAVFSGADASAAIKPHILMILVDDLGWADVSFNRDVADPEVVTPNIQKLVNEGVHLTRHYVHQYCTPTRTSLQSGRFPVHVNTGLGSPCDDNTGVSQNMTGFAEILQRAGYYTAMAGKWDAGAATPAHTPHGRGYNQSLNYFSHKNDFWSQANMQTCCESDQTIIDFWETDHGASDWNSTGYSEYLYNDFLMNVITNHDPAQPLMLFYAPHVAHCPLQVPRDVFDKFNFMTDDEGKCSAQTVKGVHTIDPHYPDLPYKCRQQYKAMVSIMDDVVGNLTDALRAKGMWDNLFVALSSDNGGPVDLAENAANNWPLRGGKYSLFEGGIRSAAFISGGMLPPLVRGTVNSGIIHVADWYATFAGLAGMDPTDHRAAAAGDLPPIDSIDMGPFLTGAVKTSPRANTPIPVGGNCLVLGDYKIITSKSSPDFWQGPRYPNASSVNIDSTSSFSPPPRAYPRLAPCYSGTNTTLREMQQWTAPAAGANGTVCSVARLASPCWNVQNSKERLILWARSETDNALFSLSSGMLTVGSGPSGSCVGALATTGELAVVPGCHGAAHTSGWTYDATTMQIRVEDGADEMCVVAFLNGTSDGPAPPGGAPFLFDVATDMTEQTNLYNDPAHAALVANMTSILAAERAKFFTNKDRFDNDCPPETQNCACWMAKNRYGGFMGPYAMLSPP